MHFKSIKIALVQGLIVLVPTYTMAFLTEQMVWTIPMLAAAGFVASSLKTNTTERRVDEDNESGQHEIEDG